MVDIARLYIDDCAGFGAFPKPVARRAWSWEFFGCRNQRDRERICSTNLPDRLMKNRVESNCARRLAQFFQTGGGEYAGSGHLYSVDVAHLSLHLFDGPWAGEADYSRFGLD